MPEESIVPDLQACVLCEDVRAEVGGQQSVIGILSAIAAPSLPIGFFKLCLWTRWCGGVGEFTQTSRIFGPDEEHAIASSEVQFSLLDLEANTTNVNVFAGVQFQRYGTYSIEVLLNNELQLRISLPVVKIPPAQN